MIDVGIARAAMIVDRIFQRKKKTTTAANIAPRTRCSSMAWSEFSINSDWSRTMATLKSGGSVGMIWAIRSLTFLMRATVLEPDCLRTPNATAGLPSSESVFVGSAPLSSTRPISLNLIEKLSLVAMTMLLKSSTLLSLLMVLKPIVFAPSTNVPPGSSWFCAVTALVTCETVRL